MRDKEGNPPGDTNDILDENIMRENYYRGIDSKRSILQEHFTDHSLGRPPTFSEREHFREKDVQNESQNFRNN